MPGLDRTGPEGRGSRTGRRFGKCNPDSQSNETDTTSNYFPDGRGLGRGLGRGGAQGRNRFRGGGRGFGRNR
jgi:hypothetical protein